MTLAPIQSIELTLSSHEINDIKTVVGSDNTLKVYISPGGEPMRAWNDDKQKLVKTTTKQPDPWQYNIIRAAFQRVNNDFGITLQEVKNANKADTQIKLTTIPNADAVSGQWIPETQYDDHVFLSMSYQSGLDGSKYPLADPNKANHDPQERLVWGKIFIHELGHLLGLEHPFDQDDGDWATDSPDIRTVDTVMGWNFDSDLAGNIYTYFQEADQQALQTIWGSRRDVPMDSETGTTIEPTAHQTASDLDPNVLPTIDTIKGSKRNDQLRGKATSVHLYGMRGDDTLIGSHNDDRLDGGGGNDVLSGRKGADTYVLSKGKDRFKGLKLRQGDVIEIESSIDFTLQPGKNRVSIRHDSGITLIPKMKLSNLEEMIEID